MRNIRFEDFIASLVCVAGAILIGLGTHSVDIGLGVGSISLIILSGRA
jgi:hypothetical protein